MSQAATVLAHAGSHGEGGGSALTVGIVVVLVLGWASLGALAWIFHAAKKRDDLRAREDVLNAPAATAPRWEPLDAAGMGPERPGPAEGAAPATGNGDAAHGGRDAAAPTSTTKPAGRLRP